MQVRTELSADFGPKLSWSLAPWLAKRDLDPVRFSVIENNFSKDTSLELPLEVFEGNSKILKNLLGNPNQSFHLQGRALSIASMDELDHGYLEKLKKIASLYQVRSFGDFLAWTGVGGKHLHALMPAVLNSSMIEHLREKILRVQDVLKRPLVLENPLSPVAFKANEMNESVFLNELHKETNASFALNLSTFYLNSVSQEFDPEARLQELNWRAISQLKISILPAQLKIQSLAGEAAFDLSVWTLLSFALKAAAKQSHQIQTVFIRVDDAECSFDEMVKFQQTFKLFTKELFRGNKSAAGISP